MLGSSIEMAKSNVLDSPIIQGTVDPGTGLTMPAFNVVGGSVRLDNNQVLKWRNLANSEDIDVLKYDINNNIVMAASGGTVVFYGAAAAYALNLYNVSTLAVLLSSNGNSYFNGGNLGLGVTSPTAVLHLKAGTATANTGPLKFTSGELLTTAVAGAVEFLTDAFYATITTGPARKTFAFLESPVFTTPNIGTATATAIKVSAIQVVGAQGLAVADATDAASVILRLNDLLARVRAHGLIAV